MSNLLSRSLFMPVLIMALVAVGCSPSGGVVGDSNSGPADPPQPPAPAYDLYVDPVGGSDITGTGSEAAPFRTITKAMSEAQAGDHVKALPGTYHAGNGEQFPIVLPPSVKLVGDPDHRGDGQVPTVINGHGLVAGYNNMEAAVVPLNESSIAGFTITNNHESADPFVYDIGIFVNSYGVEIIRNTIRDNVDYGVRFYAGADNGVFSTNVVDHNRTGLVFRHGGQGTRIEFNKVIDNNAGVILMTADAGDLGGGVAGSQGQNIFARNSDSDVMLFAGGGAFFFAENNYWDHIPPTTHTGINPGPPAGVDIWYASGDTIKTDGAKKYYVLQIIPYPGFTIQP